MHISKQGIGMTDKGNQLNTVNDNFGCTFNLHVLKIQQQECKMCPASFQKREKNLLLFLQPCKRERTSEKLERKMQHAPTQTYSRCLKQIKVLHMA